MSTTALTSRPANLACNGNTFTEVTLDDQRIYELIHNQVNASGVTDTALIYITDVDSGGLLTADASAEEGKAILSPSVSITIGPGWSKFYHASDSGQAPTFTILPSADQLGKF